MTRCTARCIYGYREGTLTSKLGTPGDKGGYIWVQGRDREGTGRGQSGTTTGQKMVHRGQLQGQTDTHKGQKRVHRVQRRGHLLRTIKLHICYIMF
jgi:hypothetical protein